MIAHTHPAEDVNERLDTLSQLWEHLSAEHGLLANELPWQRGGSDAEQEASYDRAVAGCCGIHTVCHEQEGDDAVVQLELPARVLIEVGTDGVKEVVILPAQDPCTVADARGASQQRIDAALEIGNSSDWAPLHDLPKNVRWEG